MDKNSIALKYANAVVFDNGSRDIVDNRQIIMSLNAEMMNLGFIMSQNLMSAMENIPTATVVHLYETLIPALKKRKGADVKYSAMYPNFPQQVMEASYAELFFNAIMHYWSLGTWVPSYNEATRDVAFEFTKFIEIDVIDSNEFKKIFTRILSSNDSISEGDKQTVAWFIKNVPNLQYPDEIPFKENMCYVAGIAFKEGKDVSGLMKTATDVLRVTTYLSDGDISLAENTKYKSLPRSQRRALVNILDKVATEEDINRHRGKWVKLFHSLHVGEYSKRVNAIAKKIRNNEKIQTFNGKVQAAIDVKNVNDVVALLETRPGEFARKMDHILRVFKKDNATIVKSFAKVANKVPTRVLLQLYGNLKVRNSDDFNEKVVFPKGNMQRAVVIDTHAKLSVRTINSLLATIISTLHVRFGELGDLGKVWIDPALDGCPLPTQQRSASEGLLQVARGSRLPIGDKNTLRFFIYWIGQDIDLSATLHDENFNMIEQISYTNLRSRSYQAAHSGDITRAPRGASEFIDITIDQAAAYGARYVVMNVYVYNGPNFNEHKKCYAGWMTRSEPQSAEIYDPKTVEQKVDLTAASRNAIPVVFDLVERKAIWADLTTKTRDWYYGNNVHSNKASIQQTVKAITSLDNKTNLHELFTLHANARGTIVENKEEADTIFSFYEGITPYDITTINSEYMV